VVYRRGERPDEIVDALLDDRLVIFVGAGASVRAPSGLPLFDMLVNRVADDLDSLPTWLRSTIRPMRTWKRLSEDSKEECPRPVGRCASVSSRSSPELRPHRMMSMRRSSGYFHKRTRFASLPRIMIVTSRRLPPRPFPSRRTSIEHRHCREGTTSKALSIFTAVLATAHRPRTHVSRLWSRVSHGSVGVSLPLRPVPQVRDTLRRVQPRRRRHAVPRARVEGRKQSGTGSLQTTSTRVVGGRWISTRSPTPRERTCCSRPLPRGLGALDTHGSTRT